MKINIAAAYGAIPPDCNDRPVPPKKRQDRSWTLKKSKLHLDATAITDDKEEFDVNCHRSFINQTKSLPTTALSSSSLSCNLIICVQNLAAQNVASNTCAGFG